MTFSILGADTQTKQPVHLYKSSRPEGLLILGLQGTGKSGLMENLIIDDCKQGTGFCVIDPHGEMIDHVIERLPKNREKDVMLLDLKDYACPFGINIFSCDKNPLAVQQTVDQAMHIFDLLFDISRSTPMMSQYLRNCTQTIIANDLTMVEIPLLLQDAQFRAKCVVNCDPKVQQFWKTYDSLKLSDQQKNADFIINKLDEFLQPIPLHIIGQSKTTFDLVDSMDNGKILLVKLDNINLPSVTTLIGAMFIALLINAAGSRKKTNLFNVYADEFPTYATEDFVTLIEQTRKRRIGLCMAHQNRGQLDANKKHFYASLRQRTLGTKQKIVFSITGQDANELKTEFEAKPQPTASTPQAAQTPVTDPIGSLCSRKGGHVSDIVNTFTQEYLVPFHREMQKPQQQSSFYTKFGRYQNRNITLEESYDKLNKFFYEAMINGFWDHDELYKLQTFEVLRNHVVGEGYYIRQAYDLLAKRLSEKVPLSSHC